jgi:retron-type reverse transcriptase
MEDGAVSASDKGTPQGGLVSPILANIYLHYSLDLWFEWVFQQSCHGQSRLIRYADDGVPRKHAWVRSTQCSYAAQKMRVGPSKPLCRWRLQTTVSCVV